MHTAQQIQSRSCKHLLYFGRLNHYTESSTGFFKPGADSILGGDGVDYGDADNFKENLQSSAPGAEYTKGWGREGVS